MPPRRQAQSLAKQASRIPNPLALNMYVLGYDSKKKLTNVNQAVKENLQTYTVVSN